MTAVERLIAAVTGLAYESAQYCRDRGPVATVLDISAIALMATVVCTATLACVAVELPIAVVVALGDRLDGGP